MFPEKIYFLYALLIATICPYNGEITESTCSSLPNFHSSIICSISYFVPGENYAHTCINYLRKNTLVLQIPIRPSGTPVSIKIDAIFNISFSCTSHYPMGINLEANDPFIKVSSKEIRQRRIINEYYNVSTHSHILSVSLPRDSIFRATFNSFLSRYEVFNLQAPAEKFQMFFEYIFGTTCRMYQMQKMSTALTQQVVTIPCITFLNESFSSQQPKLKINGLFDISVPYDQTMGFLLNLRNHSPTGNYSCNQSQCETEYSLVLFTDFKMTPFTKNVYLKSGPKFSILTGKLEAIDAVNITCTSFTEKVRLEMENYHRPRNNDFNLNQLNFDFTEHEFSRPTRYVATATIRYVNITERLKVHGGFSRQYLGLGDAATISCLNSASNKLGSVDVYFDARPSLYYLAEKKVFACRSLNSKEPGAFLEGRKLESTLLALTWNCKSLIQCRFVMSNCVHSGELQPNAKVAQGCAEQLPNTKERSCMEEGGSHDILLSNDKFCKLIVPDEKGIVECTKSNSDFHLAYLYFFGFDSQMYFELDMNKEPPLNATLRIINLSVEKFFYTKGTFSFKCEAHSFFYNEGIQWFMEFANSSIIHIPKESTLESLTENYNAESTIDLHFHDKTLSKIICSAPNLNTMEWSNISMEVSMEESISAKIISPDSEVYFTIGKDEALTCYSIGIPRPTVEWTKHNETINRPLRVISETLIFPNYNSTFDGEYICTVDNGVGRDVKKFVVKTKVENAATYYIVIISLFATIIGFISILWFIYSIREARKKDAEMNKLISLLNGSSDKAEVYDEMEDDDVTITKRLFDVNYEIEKNTFYIDRKSPLGKGAYGQVFKGYLDGIDGAVAFKMLAPNSPIVNLKALISELKIMMYIGAHDNLVTMIGAYRKEIKQGILYVAMELCGWGSLESFLKANKHFFIKYLNPLTMSENVEATDCQNYKVENSVSYTLYSIKNLCKWCAQIANGMEYLGLKKVIHSDLAIRNVLLTAEGIAKVTDFGLSRRTFNYSEYVKQGNDPLPWRYLAIESLVSKVYTCQSDVWSYGNVKSWLLH